MGLRSKLNKVTLKKLKKALGMLLTACYFSLAPIKAESQTNLAQQFYFLKPKTLMEIIDKYKAQGKYGTAYSLILLNEKKYSEGVKGMLDGVKQNIANEIKNRYSEVIIVGVERFNNFTNSPGIENIVQSFIIDYLLQNNLSKVREGSNGDIVIKGDVIRLSVMDSTDTIMRSVDYVAGRNKIQNPEYNVLVQRIESVCSRASMAKQRKDEEVKGGLLTILSGALREDKYQMAEGFGQTLLANISQADELERECESLKNKLRHTDPFLYEEDKQTAVIATKKVTRTGELEVTLRVIVPSTGDVLISQNFHASNENVDYAWDGNSAAGISPKYLELPSESQIVRDLFEDIFNNIKKPLEGVIKNFKKTMLIRRARQSPPLQKLEYCGIYYALGGDQRISQEACGF